MKTPREKYHLYIDDTGTRNPDKAAMDQVRDDKMDCFGLGGIIAKEADIDLIKAAHENFCAGQKIDYPLHSWAIRGGRENFDWLKKPEKAGIFFSALEEFLLSLPMITIACVVDRPGYVERYKERFQERLWLMCKTAFNILVERAAKYVDDQGGAMELYFEGAGKAEDRALIDYMRDLKARGHDFDKDTAAGYDGLSPDDFKRLCLGKPLRRTKATPMIQIADLVLYPMAKAGYVADYPPYVKLKAAGKLIDAHLPADALATRGIKYSCFDAADTTKAQPYG